MRKIKKFRHIATAITTFIYFQSYKYHITNVYHRLDIAPMQKFLKIHYLHWKKTPYCLEHGYFVAINMGSDYVGTFFLRQDVEASFLQMEAQSHPHYASEACHALKISHGLLLEGFKKSLF